MEGADPYNSIDDPVDVCAGILALFKESKTSLKGFFSPCSLTRVGPLLFQRGLVDGWTKAAECEGWVTECSGTPPPQPVCPQQRLHITLLIKPAQSCFAHMGSEDGYHPGLSIPAFYLPRLQVGFQAYSIFVGEMLQ